MNPKIAAIVRSRLTDGFTARDWLDLSIEAIAQADAVRHNDALYYRLEQLKADLPEDVAVTPTIVEPRRTCSRCCDLLVKCEDAKVGMCLRCQTEPLTPGEVSLLAALGEESR